MRALRFHVLCTASSTPQNITLTAGQMIKRLRRKRSRVAPDEVGSVLEADQVDLREATSSDREALTALLDTYLGELATRAGFAVAAVRANTDPYLDAYFSERGRYPFLIRHNGQVAGFVLVRDPASTGASWQVAEFYVIPDRRRNGVGRRAITTLWRRFPGAWELQVHARNGAARAFWTSCIERLADGAPAVHEVHADDGLRYQFNFRIASQGLTERI